MPAYSARKQIQAGAGTTTWICAHLVQPRVGDLGEVMVLHMEAHVVGQSIERAVVAVRLLPLHTDPMTLKFWPLYPFSTRQAPDYTPKIWRMSKPLWTARSASGSVT